MGNMFGSNWEELILAFFTFNFDVKQFSNNIASYIIDDKLFTYWNSKLIWYGIGSNLWICWNGYICVYWDRVLLCCWNRANSWAWLSMQNEEGIPIRFTIRMQFFVSNRKLTQFFKADINCPPFGWSRKPPFERIVAKRFFTQSWLNRLIQKYLQPCSIINFLEIPITDLIVIWKPNLNGILFFTTPFFSNAQELTQPQ